MGKKSFEEWKRLVDLELERIYGLSSMDIPDWDYWRAWDQGVSPKQAAKQALRAAEEF